MAMQTRSANSAKCKPSNSIMVAYYYHISEARAAILCSHWTRGCHVILSRAVIGRPEQQQGRDWRCVGIGIT